MIVKNEEDSLGRCLDSVRDLVDEIILVDTGSTDRTREIAAKYTDKVFDFLWIDDFAAARNFAFSRGSMDYLLWLDADDLLLEPDRRAFLHMKTQLSPDTDVVMMRYNTGFDAQGKVSFSYYRERLIKNRAGMYWVGAVHEVIEPRGKVVYSPCSVTHRKLRPSDPNRNLRIYERMLEKGQVLEPRQQYYYGRELYYHRRYPEAITVFERFLAEGRGWLENKIDACRHGALCWSALGQEENALRLLFQSFLYDLPRAELCCDIAGHFFSREAWEQAAYWYQQALACERRDERGGFVLPEAYGYLPCIQLCVCYSRLGREDEAELYNERAAAFQPDSAAVAYNRQYFAARKERPVT